MGAAALSVGFEEGELTVGQHSEPVFPAVEVPEVHVAIGCPADAAGAEAPERHAVVGAVVEVAGVANAVGLVPAQTQGAAPARLGHGPGLCRGGSTEPGATEQ